MLKITKIFAAALLLLLASIYPAYAESTAPVRIGYFENGTFQEGAKPGAVRRGYAYEYYRKISEYTGWQYEYVYGGFSDLYQMLVDGQIDLLAGLAKTEERLGIIGYPEFPMGSETYNMIKHSEDDRITMDYSTLNGMRIGVLDSAMVQVLRKFLDEHAINAEVVTFPDHKSLILAFAWHRVDTMVAESDGSSEREDTALLYAFGASDYYLCVNKSRPDLLAALSRAQEQMMVDEPNFVNSLKIKYDIVSQKLSQAEREWLKAHDVLRVGYLNNYLPYSDTDASGNATGLIRDLIPQILEELGIMRLDVSYTGYNSYDDMIRDMNFGKIDVAFPVGGGLFFSEENGVYQSNPVASLSADLIYNEDQINQTLQTFAVNKNNRIQYYYIRAHYPDAMIFYCSSVDECLTAVAEGKVPYTTVNGFRANELLKNRKYRKLSIKPLNWPENHSFGVSLGNEGLLKILNRGVNVIGKDRLEALVNRHIGKLYSRSLYDMMMDHLWIIGLLIAAAALLAVAFFARESSHAKRRMIEREKAGRELEEKNRELAENKQALIESNEKLAASAQREQAANVAKSQFLSNMSHEIRTPINAIMGMDEMIRREAEAPQIREYAENIRTASASLLSLVNDILDFSKIEAGKMEIIPVEYEISSVLNDLVNMIKTRAEKKGLTLDVEASPELPTILYGDEIRIKQVATNVLTNAVKYTEKGGVTLRVSFEKTDEKNIRLRFSVKDTGIGIKPEDIEKLFNAFERIEEKRNRTIEGTGLGMNITKKLLELMGSRLEVESVYGEGSTFSFTVEQGVVDWTPIGDFEQAFRQAVAQRDVYHERFTAPEAKVLVVDDTKMNITVMKGLLKATKVQIDEAGSGMDALALTAEKKFDVIFLDHRMPDMDGVETFAAMRAQADGKNLETPVVCLTANAISGAREWYLEQGFNDYLTKPVQGEQLEAMLVKYLPPELVKLTETDAAKDENESEGGNESALPDWLLAAEVFDVKAGLQLCGSEEDYLEVLRVFQESAAENADVIRQFFETKDWKNYTTKVHALKSSARLVGAMELSERAKQLEAAGDRLDTEEIEKDTPGLLALYRSCAEALAPMQEPAQSDADLPEIDDASLAEAYEAIKELAASFDYDSIQLVLAELANNRVPEDKAERHARIVEAAKKPDWDALKGILEE